MVDIVSKEQRSQMMSGIRAKNTKPELVIRKNLFAEGFRYKLHDQKLPGKPDLVFPKFKTVIFINGCFWHGHDCDLFRMPSTNRDFWEIKINANKSNDLKNYDLLLASGWRIVTIWECAIKGRRKLDFKSLIGLVSEFLRNDSGAASCEFKHQ